MGNKGYIVRGAKLFQKDFLSRREDTMNVTNWQNLFSFPEIPCIHKRWTAKLFKQPPKLKNAWETVLSW